MSAFWSYRINYNPVVSKLVSNCWTLIYKNDNKFRDNYPQKFCNFVRSNFSQNMIQENFFSSCQVISWRNRTLYQVTVTNKAFDIISCTWVSQSIRNNWFMSYLFDTAVTKLENTITLASITFSIEVKIWKSYIKSLLEFW